jgi:biopolymer transport protein ExbB/TolQ
LTIAIPALAAHAYLLRRVESMAARIGLSLQALIQSKEA